MKTKKGFKLRSVLDQKVIVAEGATQFNFNKLISLNESAAALWEAAEAMDTFTNNDLADVLVAKYGIDADTALADASEISAQWLEIGLAEE